MNMIDRLTDKCSALWTENKRLAAENADLKSSIKICDAALMYAMTFGLEQKRESEKKSSTIQYWKDLYDQRTKELYEAEQGETK
jgi:hypothetical protein